jgi:hypothetical protein
MKIALLLTGHFIRRQSDSDGSVVRNYNYPSLKHFILDKHDVDVYISTWDHSFLHNGASCLPVDTNIVLDLYKPIKYHIRNHNEYYATKSIIPYHKRTVSVMMDDQLRSLPNCECNHSNRNCVVQGCTAIETNADSWSLVKEGYDLIDNPNQYDYILRSRFDLSFTNFVIDEHLPTDTIVVPPWKKNNKWDDFALGDGANAYGRPADMSKYCRFIDHLPELCQKDIMSANIHYTLGYYLKFNCGITQREDNQIIYSFLKD